MTRTNDRRRPLPSIRIIGLWVPFVLWAWILVGFGSPGPVVAQEPVSGEFKPEDRFKDLQVIKERLAAALAEKEKDRLRESVQELLQERNRSKIVCAPDSILGDYNAFDIPAYSAVSILVPVVCWPTVAFARPPIRASRSLLRVR